MKTEKILEDDLSARIERMQASIWSANACLDDNDFLQCAVRLQDAAKEAQFDDLIMNIYDSMSPGLQ